MSSSDRRGSQRGVDGFSEPRTSSGLRSKVAAPVVLVVDDIEDNVDLFASVLRGQNIVVATAYDGASALEVAAAERPLVVVTDLAMPVMDGIELIRRLRETEHGARVHIIVVSAYSDVGSRRAAAEAGADEYLAKPCAPSVLVDRVLAALAAMRDAEPGAVPITA